MLVLVKINTTMWSLLFLAGVSAEFVSVQHAVFETDASPVNVAWVPNTYLGVGRDVDMAHSQTGLWDVYGGAFFNNVSNTSSVALPIDAMTGWNGLILNTPQKVIHYIVDVYPTYWTLSLHMNTSHTYVVYDSTNPSELSVGLCSNLNHYDILIQLLPQQEMHSDTVCYFHLSAPLGLRFVNVTTYNSLNVAIDIPKADFIFVGDGFDITNIDDIDLDHTQNIAFEPAVVENTLLLPIKILDNHPKDKSFVKVSEHNTLEISPVKQLQTTYESHEYHYSRESLAIGIIGLLFYTVIFVWVIYLLYISTNQIINYT